MTRGAGAAVDESDALAADISLRSPISAEVDKVVLRQGELAPPGFPILTLVNLNDVWVVFNMRENELAAVKIGVVTQCNLIVAVYMTMTDGKLLRFDSTATIPTGVLLQMAYAATRSERVEVSCNENGAAGFKREGPV